MITPCKSSDFIKNSNEIGSFINAKKVGQKIDNVDRLLDLLSIYYSSLLFYQKNEIGKYLVNINNSTHKVTFNLINEKGDLMVLDMIEACDSIISSVFTHLKGCMDFGRYDKLQLIIISICENGAIKLNQKVSLLNSDSGIFGDFNNQYLFQINENIALKSILARINVLYSLFSNEKILSTIDDAENIYKLFHIYIRFYLKSCVFQNHFIEGIIFIKNELDRFDNIGEHIKLDDNRIVFILLNNLTTFNNNTSFKT